MPKILQLMKQRGINTVADLVKLTGIPKSTLYEIVKGKNLLNNKKYIQKIAEALGVSEEDLY